MLRTGLVLVLLLMVAGVDAQKIDKRLSNLLEQTTMRRAQGKSAVNMSGVKKKIDVDFNADGTLESVSAVATLKKGAECPTERLEQMGVTVRYVLGDMVALRVPADQLMALEQVDEFSYVQADELKTETNARAREEMEVDKVNTLEAAIAEGLPEAYTGKNVVLGIIDNGIDFNHAAFRNADGSTRIKKVIIYSEDKMEFSEYNTEDEIKMLTCDKTTSTHGTHTAAIAGGSDTGNNQQGMAPETDLILCGLAGIASSTNINYCIQKIFEYADDVKKPAVVSISLGNIIGLHDGSDIQAMAVAQLTENGTKKGRVVLVSSANAACRNQSIVKQMSLSDVDAYGYNLRTVLGATEFNDMGKPGYRGLYYFYAGDYKEFKMGWAVVDLKTGKIVQRAGKMEDKDGKVLEKEEDYPPIIYYEPPTRAGGKATAYYIDFDQLPVYMTDSDYRIAIFTKANEDGQVIKMMCGNDESKEPCFDAPYGDGIQDFRTLGFTKGNSDFACNTSVCDDATISVGAYCSRTSWLTYQGENYKYRESEVTGKVQRLGEIADFSSYCIDDNGKPRPTMIAPGMGLYSACNNYDINYFLGDEPGVVDEHQQDAKIWLTGNVNKFGRNNWYLMDQGTSMSCPAAAGVVALWLQANPELSANDVKDIIKESCINDEWTTDVTNIPSGNKVQAGLGKINCLMGLKKIKGATAIDMVRIDGQRQATPSTMYSVDAPVYNMMGQRVDRSHRGLVIYKGRKYVNK